MLSKLVIGETKKILERDRTLVARLIAERKRFENWLQIEVLKALMASHPAIEIEKMFAGGRERCDFALAEGDGHESWLELKLCVTNYCRDYSNGTSARPITNQIDQVIRDTEKLKRLPAEHLRSVLLIAYPFPNGAEPAAWRGHLVRLECAATSLADVFAVTAERDGESVMVLGYLLTV